MGAIRNLMQGRKFIRWLGKDFAQEEPLCIEMFKYTPQHIPNEIVAVGLSDKAIYISQLDRTLNFAVSQTRIPYDMVTWIDVDARSDDYPWTFDALVLATPIEFSSTGHGTRLVRLLAQKLMELDGAESHPRLAHGSAYIEFFPWRPNSPGGWTAVRTGDLTKNDLDQLVIAAQHAYRRRSRIVGVTDSKIEYFKVPARPDEKTCAHMLLRSIGMSTCRAAIVGLTDTQTPHLVGIDDQERVAVVQIPVDQTAAQPPPMGAIASINDAIAQMSLYSIDLNSITLTIPPYPARIKIAGSDLEDTEWEPLVLASIRPKSTES